MYTDVMKRTRPLSRVFIAHTDPPRRAYTLAPPGPGSYHPSPTPHVGELGACPAALSAGRPGRSALAVRPSRRPAGVFWVGGCGRVPSRGRRPALAPVPPRAGPSLGALGLCSSSRPSGPLPRFLGPFAPRRAWGGAGCLSVPAACLCPLPPWWVSWPAGLAGPGAWCAGPPPAGCPGSLACLCPLVSLSRKIPVGREGEGQRNGPKTPDTEHRTSTPTHPGREHDPDTSRGRDLSRTDRRKARKQAGNRAQAERQGADEEDLREPAGQARQARRRQARKTEQNGPARKPGEGAGETPREAPGRPTGTQGPAGQPEA